MAALGTSETVRCKQEGSTDFPDYLHTALVGQAGQRPFLTLDECASRLEGAVMLS
jgi:hypothetical protein